MGSGCDLVGRAVASDSRSLRFGSSHRQKMILNILLWTVVKRQKKKKRPGMAHFLKITYFCFITMYFLCSIWPAVIWERALPPSPRLLLHINICFLSLKSILLFNLTYLVRLHTWSSNSILEQTWSRPKSIYLRLFRKGYCVNKALVKIKCLLIRLLPRYTCNLSLPNCHIQTFFKIWWIIPILTSTPYNLSSSIDFSGNSSAVKLLSPCESRKS